LENVQKSTALVQNPLQVRLVSAPLNELMALGIKRPAQHSTAPTWSLSELWSAEIPVSRQFAVT
jgi:hypothetical protein